MSTALLSDASATQLTFPWATADCEAIIVTDRGSQTETRQPEPRRLRQPAPRALAPRALAPRALAPCETAPCESAPCESALCEPALHSPARLKLSESRGESSLAEAMDGDRIGRPFRVGSVMFRLLKSYGITDEEIAEGIAQYAARQQTAK